MAQSTVPFPTRFTDLDDAAAVQAAIDSASDDASAAAVAVATETTARQQADAGLASAIASEANARQQADTDLGTLVASRAPLDSPAFTGIPSAPTQAGTDNSTKLATTAFVVARLAELIAGAPSNLDTLKEITDQLANDESALNALINTVSGKLAKASNLADLTNAATARTNLGLGTAATHAATDFDAAGAAASATTTAHTELTAHTGRTDNPHATTAAQVGAYTTQQVDTALAGKFDKSGGTIAGTVSIGSNGGTIYGATGGGLALDSGSNPLKLNSASTGAVVVSTAFQSSGLVTCLAGIKQRNATNTADAFTVDTLGQLALPSGCYVNQYGTAKFISTVTNAIDASSGTLGLVNNGSSAAGNVGLAIGSGTYNATSSIQIIEQVKPTVAQTGAASLIARDTLVTITSKGTGGVTIAREAKVVGGTTTVLRSLDDSGNQTLAGGLTTAGYVSIVGPASGQHPLSFGNYLFNSGTGLCLYESSNGSDFYGFKVTAGSVDFYAGGVQTAAFKSAGNGTSTILGDLSIAGKASVNTLTSSGTIQPGTVNTTTTPGTVDGQIANRQSDGKLVQWRAASSTWVLAGT